MSPPTFADLESREYLEANGRGGWCSGTYAGSGSRRYHGVLVAALRPPVGRCVLLSKLDETLECASGSYALAANRFPGAAPSDDGVRVAEFGRGDFPWMAFEAGGVRVRKTLAAVWGEDLVLLRYEAAPGCPPCRLILRPFLAPRGIHSLAHANPYLRAGARWDGGTLALAPYDGVPGIHLRVEGASFTPGPDWWYRFQYERERERGLDFEEDLWTPGTLAVELVPGKPVDVAVSTGDPAGRDLDSLWRSEAARRAALRAGVAGRGRLGPRLGLAADQFLVRGRDRETVLAGYPWFEDWGRDTMIALRGLCLSRGLLPQARGILESFLGALDQGMLPNRFPEAGAAPEYNTVDATLWLFVAVHDFWRAGGDRGFVLERCLPALKDCVDWHLRGTRYGIGVDPDGLLRAGAAGVQLTWMDAKVGDWVVTPRRGKPVEVNALWYNALRVTQALAEEAGDRDAARALAARAEGARTAFSAGFWDESLGRCRDVLAPEGPDPSPRPNQIFALSLPFPLLDEGRSRRVLDWVEVHLLTPRGLRSLAPGDPRYVGRYEGGVGSRDGAYHQGTVWAWLMGPTIDALLRYRGREGLRRAQDLLAGFEPHLDEACLGSVSEIFDGDPPHAPRGCFAQAWSVGELLRAARIVEGASAGA